MIISPTHGTSQMSYALSLDNSGIDPRIITFASACRSVDIAVLQHNFQTEREAILQATQAEVIFPVHLIVGSLPSDYRDTYRALDLCKSAGVNMLTRNGQSYSPLHIAAESNNLPALKWLISHLDSTRASLPSPDTPASIALHHQYNRLRQQALTAPGDWSLAHAACKNDAVECLAWLHKHGNIPGLSCDPSLAVKATHDSIKIIHTVAHVPTDTCNSVVLPTTSSSSSSSLHCTPFTSLAPTLSSTLPPLPPPSFGASPPTHALPTSWLCFPQSVTDKSVVWTAVHYGSTRVLRWIRQHIPLNIWVNAAFCHFPALSPSIFINSDGSTRVERERVVCGGGEQYLKRHRPLHNDQQPLCGNSSVLRSAPQLLRGESHTLHSVHLNTVAAEHQRPVCENEAASAHTVAEDCSESEGVVVRNTDNANMGRCTDGDAEANGDLSGSSDGMVEEGDTVTVRQLHKYNGDIGDTVDGKAAYAEGERVQERKRQRTGEKSERKKEERGREGKEEGLGAARQQEEEEEVESESMAREEVAYGTEWERTAQGRTLPSQTRWEGKNWQKQESQISGNCHFLANPVSGCVGESAPHSSGHRSNNQTLMVDPALTTDRRARTLGTATIATTATITTTSNTIPSSANTDIAHVAITTNVIAGPMNDNADNTKININRNTSLLPPLAPARTQPHLSRLLLLFRVMCMCRDEERQHRQGEDEDRQQQRQQCEGGEAQRRYEANEGTRMKNIEQMDKNTGPSNSEHTDTSSVYLRENLQISDYRNTHQKSRIPHSKSHFSRSTRMLECVTSVFSSVMQYYSSLCTPSTRAAHIHTPLTHSTHTDTFSTRILPSPHMSNTDSCTGGRTFGNDTGDSGTGDRCGVGNDMGMLACGCRILHFEYGMMIPQENPHPENKISEEVWIPPAEFYTFRTKCLPPNFGKGFLSQLLCTSQALNNYPAFISLDTTFGQFVFPKSKNPEFDGCISLDSLLCPSMPYLLHYLITALHACLINAPNTMLPHTYKTFTKEQYTHLLPLFAPPASSTPLSHLLPSSVSTSITPSLLSTSLPLSSLASPIPVHSHNYTSHDLATPTLRNIPRSLSPPVPDGLQTTAIQSLREVNTDATSNDFTRSSATCGAVGRALPMEIEGVGGVTWILGVLNDIIISCLRYVSSYVMARSQRDIMLRNLHLLSCIQKSMLAMYISEKSPLLWTRLLLKRCHWLDECIYSMDNILENKEIMDILRCAIYSLVTDTDVDDAHASTCLSELLRYLHEEVFKEIAINST